MLAVSLLAFRVFNPMLYACKASSDDVVAWSAGVSYFCTEASDSPNFSRIADTARAHDFSTSSFPFAPTRSATRRANKGVRTARKKRSNHLAELDRRSPKK